MMFNMLMQDFKHWMGYPADVYGALEQYPTLAATLPPIELSCSLQHSVCAWHHWITSAAMRFRNRRQMAALMGEIFIRHDDDDVKVDIRDIEGLGCSRSPLNECSDLDRFAISYCQRFLGAHDAHSLLASLLARGDYRLHKYSWDRRIFLSNSDGSHRFAAARYIAGQRALPIPVHLPMSSVSVDSSRLAVLRSSYSMLVINAVDADARLSLLKACRAVDAPYSALQLPQPYITYDVWCFPRASKRAVVVADALSEHGAQDFGVFLFQMVKQ